MNLLKKHPCVDVFTHLMYPVKYARYKYRMEQKIEIELGGSVFHFILNLKIDKRELNHET